MQSRIASTFSLLRPYVIILLGLWWFLGMSTFLSAAQPANTKTPVVPLQQVQRVLITTLALTERGSQDSAGIHQVVSERMAQAGFTPVTDATMPHDIMVRVKCEERKSKTGPSKHRKGDHPLSMTSRLWKGPACHISYRYQSQPALWGWEVYTSFEEPRKAAKAAGANNSGLYALQKLEDQLAQDEFPLYLATEWGQTDRLINLFQQATDQPDRRRLILQLLGSLTSPNVLTTIQEATQDPILALTAIAALGGQGEIAVPTLAGILDSPGSPEQHLATLTALGEIATHSTAPGLYEQFIQQLQSPDPRMQTIAVRGLAALGNQSAIIPIEALNVQAWSNPSTHPDMQALREALNDALYQLDPQAGSH